MKETAEATDTAEAPKPIEGLTIGRIVHYVLDKPYSAGEPPTIRPAIVVHVWDRQTGSSNLQVIVDGTNDGYESSTGTVWKTSCNYSEGREPGTWHWPPRV
ncbi:MAG TPA: hypothetical protein VGV59_03400 [Pyrinomonadaceae bacterium]|nr:hypothetical protein [Pyrinomonadaceae bacterium]